MSGQQAWAETLTVGLGRLGGAELASRVRFDHPIGPLTTYRVGGAAAAFVIAERPEDLAAIAGAAGELEAATMVIGRGSNLLVADRGIDAIVVQLGEGLAQVHVVDAEASDRAAVSVTAGGAALLPVVARLSVSSGWTGFEWAVGVPGSIGGAVRMNAGGHGSDMAASVVRVRAVDLRGGEDTTMDASALQFGYRHCALRRTQVVYSVDLRLRQGDRAASTTELSGIVRWRREHQPGGQNAGSVFRNPPGTSAGALIEAAGCKGRRVGSAEVSAKHANFIQVDADGRADDVLELMAQVRARVRAATGIELMAETHVVGAEPSVCEAAGVAESVGDAR